MFGFNHVEHILEGEGLEIEAVAGVVVRGDGFRVAVHHHRRDAGVLGGEGGMAAAVIEFDPLANPVGATPEDHHLASTVVEGHLAFRLQGCEVPIAVQLLERALIGGVVVWRGGCKFRSTGVHGLEHGSNTKAMAMTTHT